MVFITGISARADVFELKGGGRVEGQIVATADGDKSQYVIELTAGGRLTLPRSQVARIDTTTASEAEYQKLARSSPDTVEAHWKLAEWCRERKLLGAMKQHLARILELDPNHREARTASGFRQQSGEWMTRDDVMASRGMVMYEGRYVTPQHVELLERQKETKGEQADWGNSIERLRRWLTGRREDRVVQARAELETIRDPAAAEAVVGALRREKDPDLKRLWIEIASRLDHQVAVDALVDRSLADPEEEVRYQSLEYLIKSGRPGLVKPYIRALRNRDNEIVNRAGAALGQIGDPDAIGPLIDALVTMHKVKVSDANADQHAYTFSPDGSAFSFGGGGPQVVQENFQNPSVLSALVTLSGGASFDYDQEQWRRWLAAQAKHNAIDVRRDQ
ncbi:MAG: HEAT repeat domain-containing protein [Planctomycetes bacterium]|nr:HEAT repeat domain-containing protein [Planctomycetota bacterium]